MLMMNRYIIIFLIFSFQVTAATFSVFVLSSEDNRLTPERAFVSLALFNNMRWSIIVMPHAIAYMIQAKVSLGRIVRYLLGEELRVDIVDICQDPG